MPIQIIFLYILRARRHEVFLQQRHLDVDIIKSNNKKEAGERDEEKERE